MTPDPILKLIRTHEAQPAVHKQGVDSPYDVVWGGIEEEDRPKKPLTEMTVREVLLWQDSIDQRYLSEAAGAYQIMEDTLRGLVAQQPSLLDYRFSADIQDKLAMMLLERRGWNRLVNGEISAAKFGDQLAREWASFPVLSQQRGASRIVNRGQSYYAGDGLNKAYVKPELVEKVIAEAMASDIAPTHDLQAMAEWLEELDELMARRPMLVV